MNLSRVLCGIACIFFLIGAMGRVFGLTGEATIILFWGAFFFAAGHVF